MAEFGWDPFSGEDERTLGPRRLPGVLSVDSDAPVVPIKSKTDPAALANAVADYLNAVRFNLSDLASDGATTRCPNGEVVTIVADAMDVASFIGRRVSSREEFGFALGLVVGAALSQKGTLPVEYREVVERIVDEDEARDG